jgi:hypothetical protein
MIAKTIKIIFSALPPLTGAAAAGGALADMLPVGATTPAAACAGGPDAFIVAPHDVQKRALSSSLVPHPVQKAIFHLNKE